MTNGIEDFTFDKRKSFHQSSRLSQRKHPCRPIAISMGEMLSNILLKMAKLGCDYIDASSGGNHPNQKITLGPGYQVPFARQIREEAAILTGAVGLITEVSHANEIITEGDADLILLGRELLREPYWAIKAQQELGKDPSWPVQYGYAVKRRAK